MSRSRGDGRLSPSLWFTLYHLLTKGAGARPVRISTTALSKSLGCSQQSASRHLRLLGEMGLISRRIEADGSLLKITERGLDALGEVYHGLKRHLEGEEAESFVFEGRVFSGLCEGAYYLSLPGYRNQIKEKLGFDPYPGTLNLRISEEDVERRKRLERLPSIRIEGFRDVGRGFGGARCYPLTVNDEVEGALIIADRSSYRYDVMEIISPIYLRGHFKLEDGDWVRIRISNPQRSSSLS